jgi:hypothetical protein
LEATLSLQSASSPTLNIDSIPIANLESLDPFTFRGQIIILRDDGSFGSTNMKFIVKFDDAANAQNTITNPVIQLPTTFSVVRLRWQVDTWSTCPNNECNRIRTRTVACQQSTQNLQWATVSDDYCKPYSTGEQIKPAEQDPVHLLVSRKGYV